MGAVIGPPEEVVEELYDPYHRCAPVEPTGCCFRIS